MSLVLNENPITRELPGRLRLKVKGLKENPKMVDQLTRLLSRVDGIEYVHPSSLSGRMLIKFDQEIIRTPTILKWLQVIEEQGFEEQEIIGTEPNGSNQGIPLPLLLSMGGLTILTAKQLFWGKSAFASSSIPFYLSGLVSVLSGYPFIKRGVQQWTKDKPLNADLLLGTSALALALVRENIVVLAGLSMLQLLNWKQQQAGMDSNTSTSISPQIRAYSEKASKWGMIAAGATWAITRSPLRGLAVLLAANPRPATIPGEFAWNQAELVAKEKIYTVPTYGSLAKLSRTKTILLEDTAQLFNQEIQDIQWQALTKDQDTDKVICLAAALMEKSTHAWKSEIGDKAKSTCRTLRTAFQFEEEADGMKGRVNNANLLLGNLSYLERNGVQSDIYILEEKRMRRKGFDVLFLAKQGIKNSSCIGILLCRSHYNTKLTTALGSLYPIEGQIGVLQDSLNMGSFKLKQLGLDSSWLSLPHEQVLLRINELNSQGEEVLYIADNEFSYPEAYHEAKIPYITIKQIPHMKEVIELTRRIDQWVDQQANLTKGWNVIGSILGAVGLVSAPVINLAADALSLVFLSRSKKISKLPVEHRMNPMDSLELYQQEVAAASEVMISPESLWHTMPSEAVYANFQVSEQHGLNTSQVHALRQRFGWNQLEGKKPTSFLIAYLMQFKEFTTLILLGTSVLALISGDIFDGIAMGGILLANSAIGTIQERKAEKVVENLNQFQPMQCKVIRNSQVIELQATELVPGDLVTFESGDRIPADLRLVRSWSLQINESALTGESLPIEKNEDSLEESTPLTDRKNMLYMGTDVSRGRGLGVVVATGMNTEMGHLVALLKSDKKEVTPLQEKVTSISKTFIKGALIAGGLVFVAGLLRGIPITQMITTSVTLAASAIPEGLPVTITIALSAGVFRMAKKNALIRKLSALETLGRTTIICTDKTGTLTKNEMTVKAIATIDSLWSVTGIGYEPSGTIAEISSNEVAAASNAFSVIKPLNDVTDHPELKRLFQIGMLCNNSKLQQQDGRWSIHGDPTEGALLTLAAKAQMWLHQMPEWHRGTEVPFDSNTGKMSVVCRDTQLSNHDCFIFSKGSIETILRHSNKYQVNGEIRSLTDEQKKIILQQNESLAADALRVLGFAYRPLQDHENENDLGLDENNMIYIGMVGMIDPPKPEIQHCIQEALQLDVKPVMITGDHPITAIAIAKQLGIFDGTQTVVTGQELERLTEEEFLQVINEVTIFARVTPEQKLRIVTTFQKGGHIVAMTGDGVNDTPAIKQADIGIAMGQTGTEVTKRTAVMILKEDHFGSIVEGVKEGRTIISNIRKALGCLLTGNLSEVLVTSVAVIIGLPIPFVPIQILLMNLLTDAIPAMVLAVNPGNKQKQTRRIDIIDKELYQKIMIKGGLLGLGSLSLFAASLALGAPLAAAQSVAFATLVSGQLIQTFSWRQEGMEETVRDWSKDRFLIGALGVSWLALLSVLYIPPVAAFFHTVPLSFKYWIPILLVAGSVSILSKGVMSLISTNPTQDAAASSAQLNYAI